MEAPVRFMQSVLRMTARPEAKAETAEASMSFSV